MRGMAALWVVLHHAKLSATGFIGPVENSQLAANGFLGVDFFFVLSGFIIAYSSSRMIAAGKGVQSYFTARLIRIYVPYLPIGVGLFLLYLMMPGVSASQRAPGLLTSLTLLPTNNPPALSVAWTLVHEIIFYCVFAIYFVSKRGLTLALVLWSVAIVAVYCLSVNVSLMANYFLSPLNLCFLLGVLACKLGRREFSSAWIWVLALVGSLLIAGVAFSVAPNRAVSAIGFFLLVIAASSAHMLSMRVPKAFMILGAASYSVYLVHNPLLSIVMRGIKKGLPGLGSWSALLLAAFIATTVGVIYWAVYERNALRFVRARFSAHKNILIGVPERV